MRLSHALTCLTLCAIGPISFADSIAAPEIKIGDTWVYRNTAEKAPDGWIQTHNQIAVTRVSSSSIYFTAQQIGSTQAAHELFTNLDWSRTRDVGDGKETLVSQPAVFPLSKGKTWELDYTELQPSHNKNFSSELWHSKFTVAGNETVEVPAGKFDAIKIEAEGTWTAQLSPSRTIVQGVQNTAEDTASVSDIKTTTARQVTGRTYKAYWYVPEIKRWVKEVDEVYNTNGVRTSSQTDELESFKPGT